MGKEKGWEGGECGGGGERGVKMEGSDKKLESRKQPTSKSLSNLIGVIESFRLLRH